MILLLFLEYIINLYNENRALLELTFLCRYYLDTLNDPFVMDDPQCALITEQAYAYFKLSYQEKVKILLY